MTRIQKPIGSGFGHHSTATDVLDGIDLHGKNFIVTGGYSGIGIESVRALAAAGAHVLVPARNRKKAEAALADVQGKIVIADMDLGNLNAVRKFTDQFNDEYKSLHGLINNAGIMACPLSRIGNNWESQFATCHIGHFELTRGLERVIKNTENARVVALSSTAHILSDVHWDDPHFHNHAYDKWQAYGSAKSANALFALGVDEKWKSDGVRAFSVHPGGIFTPLQRHLSDEEMVILGWKNADGTTPPAVEALFKNTEQGGSTAVWAATSPALNDIGGLYCEDCDVAQAATEESQRYHHARDWIGDVESAERLWAMTERMIAG
jgi:NAD(P)-dependent dehydrogenase (short-subunit alcohol dehydrogenase family)